MIQIQASRSNGPDTDFWYVCTVTITVWHWVKVMTNLQNRFGNRQQFFCEILSWFNMAVRRYVPDTDFGCVYCELDLGDMILVKQMTIMWNIIQKNTKELMHRHCGINNRAPRWTFTDTCKPKVRPGAREESASPAWLAAPSMNARDTAKVYMTNMTLRSFAPRMDLGYVCIVTLTLEILSWFKVKPHLLVVTNNSLKHYQYPTLQWVFMHPHGFCNVCSVRLTLGQEHDTSLSG